MCIERRLEGDAATAPWAGEASLNLLGARLLHVLDFAFGRWFVLVHCPSARYHQFPRPITLSLAFSVVSQLYAKPGSPFFLISVLDRFCS